MARTVYQPDPADVELVTSAWKSAPCNHYRDAVCLSCSSTAILRALAERYELVERARYATEPPEVA